MGLGYPVCLQLHRNYGFQSCQYPLTVNAKLFIWLVINIISQASEEAGADFILARYMCISFSATFFFFSLPLLSVFEYLYITKKRWIQSKVFDGATAKRAILKLLIFSINIKKKASFVRCGVHHQRQVMRVFWRRQLYIAVWQWAHCSLCRCAEDAAWKQSAQISLRCYW